MMFLMVVVVVVMITVTNGNYSSHEMIRVSIAAVGIKVY
jgi:uncharacterized oligopeptide transporter (OPT) family protein